MNLMDMLSVDPPSTIYGKINEPYEDTLLSTSTTNNTSINGKSSINSYSYSNINNDNYSNEIINNFSETPEQQVQFNSEYINASGVYYIPTKLTRIQLSLIEILLHLFSETLIDQFKLKKKKTSIDSLLEVSNLQTTLEPSSLDHSNNSNDLNLNYELISICFNKLNLINNHPSLLVDHFIPKKLLLSETNEMKISMSGKFELFNRIIDSLIELNLTKYYSILVVSKNNKELELIEGMILGKNISYKNSSTLKLYNEDNKTNQNGIFINLIQTQQLYNNYMNLSSNTNYKFIFSFDSKLDYTNPSIEMLRSNKNCPIYIPIPIYSIEHLILQIPEPKLNGYNDSISNNPSFEWKLKILNTLIVNSFNLDNNKNSDFYLENYEANMRYFINNCVDYPLKLENLFQKYNDNLIINYSDEKLLKKLNQSYNKFISGKLENSIPLNLENFNRQFIELCNLKLNSLNNKINDINTNQLPMKRKLETSKQLHFDDDEKLICESYYKLKKLNNEATTIDKKLNRYELDLNKQNDNNLELENQLKEINEIKDSINDEIINKQIEQITNLKNEINELLEEYNKLIKETEEIRINYQKSSTEAVTKQSKLNKKLKILENLNSKLNSKGLQFLPKLIQINSIKQYENLLNQLKNQNKFLNQVRS
ncbi:HDA2 [Candida jiufengensis]|uniref:HDA2 n=1 Tax=Candida jiufengensis TaxID=497108 RepID=UPI0022243F25|nr:HDA2 [Candida jiufengensis]KAI5952900.1 HDA2 [Candida jiufengensis]